MQIQISRHIKLTDLPVDLEQELVGRFQFPNPKWLENERMGRWNHGTPKTLKYYRKLKNGGLIIPRGYMRQLILLCRKNAISYTIDDKRRRLGEITYQFDGRLKDFQAEAAAQMLKKEFGVFGAPTGSGKTVVALYMIAARRQPALIIVHTKDLAFQWMSRIQTFLGESAGQVGLIGAGKHEPGQRITVALVQSLYKRAKQISPQIGFLIVDESHRCPSRTFTEAVSAFDSRYMLGLSATPWRRDKLSRLIFWYLGDMHHQVDKAELIKDGHVLPVEVVVRETAFRPYYDPTHEYSKMLAELTGDKERNVLIAADVAREAAQDTGVCLVLSDRKEHCHHLATLLRYRYKVPSEVLTGDLSEKQRREVLEKLNQGHVKVLIATGALIGEGFDHQALTTLFLATPIRFSGRVIQYLGRVLRPAPGKNNARLYDYVDVHVGPLLAAAKARQRIYDI